MVKTKVTEGYWMMKHECHSHHQFLSRLAATTNVTVPQHIIVYTINIELLTPYNMHLTKYEHELVYTTLLTVYMVQHVNNNWLTVYQSYNYCCTYYAL